MFKSPSNGRLVTGANESFPLGKGDQRSSSGNLVAGTSLNRQPARPLLHLGFLELGRTRRHTPESQTAADLLQFSQSCQIANGSGFAREMSAPYFAENPNGVTQGAVAFLSCKAGQHPTRALTYSALLQLLVLESFARKHPDVAPVALIGLESGNRGLLRSAPNHGYETLCRFAFRLHRFLESRPTLFSRVTPILDTEVLNAPDALGFSRRRKTLDLTDSERIATSVHALNMTSGGSQLKIGASNFGSRRDIDHARRFADRNQLNLFLGQTVAEDELLRGSVGFLYAQGPASRRLAQLTFHGDALDQARWLLVDHLALSESEFRQSWQEHEQLNQLYNVISELDPALSIVDEQLAWALDCSQRMMAFHDTQLFEVSTGKNGIAPSNQALEALKRDYTWAIRTYLRDLAARNYSWMSSIAADLGFLVTDSHVTTNLVASDSLTSAGPSLAGATSAETGLSRASTVTASSLKTEGQVQPRISTKTAA